MLKRLSVFAYGLICYAVFFATYLYAVGFVGNLLVPRTIDGTPAGSLPPAWSSISFCCSPSPFLSLAARAGATYWAVVAPHGPRSDL